MSSACYGDPSQVSKRPAHLHRLFFVWNPPHDTTGGCQPSHTLESCGVGVGSRIHVVDCRLRTHVEEVVEEVYALYDGFRAVNVHVTLYCHSAITPQPSIMCRVGLNDMLQRLDVICPDFAKMVEACGRPGLSKDVERLYFVYNTFNSQVATPGRGTIKQLGIIEGAFIYVVVTQRKDNVVDMYNEVYQLHPWFRPHVAQS